MTGPGRAIREIHSLEDLAERGTFLCRIHPLAKVLVTIWYLILVMSFGKYDIEGLWGMSIYPVILMILGDISAGEAIRRMRPILLMVCLVGLANPLFDRELLGTFGGMKITSGMLSMVTLFFKTVFAVAAAYILMATTTMEQICYALRKLHVPQILVTVLLLIYRYLVMMLKEADRIMQAYRLRAPGERGIRKDAWGPLAGQMLLRSMDRAQAVYESMTLRGFRGEFFLRGRFVPPRRSAFYGIGWAALLAVFRFLPVFRIVGSVFIS